MIKWWTKLKKKLALYFSSTIDEETLNNLLDIIAINYKRKKRVIDHIIFMYPSELSKCLKITFYKYKHNGLVTGLNPSAQAGNVVDEGIENLVKKVQKKNKRIYLIHKFPVHYTIKTEDKLIIISGSIDFVAKNAIIEIKSSNSPKLEILQGDIYQTGFYAMALRKEFNRNFDAYLIYIYRKLYLKRIYKLSEEEIKEGFETIVNRALELYNYLKENKEPQPNPSYWCTGCPLLEKCKEGKEFIKNVLKDDPKKYIERQKKDLNRFVESYKKLFGKAPF